MHFPTGCAVATGLFVRVNVYFEWWVVHLTLACCVSKRIRGQWPGRLQKYNGCAVATGLFVRVNVYFDWWVVHLTLACCVSKRIRGQWPGRLQKCKSKAGYDTRILCSSAYLFSSGPPCLPSLPSVTPSGLSLDPQTFLLADSSKGPLGLGSRAVIISV